MRTRSVAVVCGAALLALSAGACTSSTSTSSTSAASHAALPTSHAASSMSEPPGTARGTLRLVGGPYPGVNRPAPGTVYAYGLSSGQTPIATARADVSGSFAMALPPGTYHLAGSSPDFTIDPPPGLPPCRAASPVVVITGRVSAADVICSMR